MAISISRAVKKYLRPVMEKYGYQYTGSQMGCWDFEKNGRRKQNVFVQRCMDSRLRLELRLSPSFRHKHIELEESYLKRYLMYRGFGREWPFQTQEDVETIIKCFAQIMEEKGFDMMEQADSDPLDVVPTPQMQERLFAEHGRLAEKFLRDNDLEFWDHRNYVGILAPKLLDYQERFVQDEDHEELLEYVAAYGLVLEKLGAKWVMSNGNCILELRVRNTKISLNYPMTVIFHALHFADQDSIFRMLEMDVQNVLRACSSE